MDAKTWGPFTGNHIVAMVGVVAFAIGVPGTLRAVDAFTNVAITDALTGDQARVVSKRLAITNAGKALKVEGQLIAAEASPADFVLFEKTVHSGSRCAALLTAPADKGVIVKSVFVDREVATGGGNSQHVRVYVAPSCPSTVPSLQVTSPRLTAGWADGNTGVTALQLEPGLAVPPGATLWAQSVGGNWHVVYGTGYFVPAAAFPPVAPASAKRAARQ